MNKRRTSTKKNKSGRKQKGETKPNATLNPPVPVNPVSITGGTAATDFFAEGLANFFTNQLLSEFIPGFNPPPLEPADDCSHGILEDTPNDIITQVVEIFNNAQPMKEYSLQGIVASHSEYPSLFYHPATIPLLLGISANQFLSTHPNCWENATVYVKMAIFASMRQKNKQKNRDFNDSTQCRDELNRVHKVVSKNATSAQDIVTYLDRKLPCNCLSEFKQHVLQQEESWSCNICKGQFSKIQMCSRCHVVGYCSKECQHADWPKHKIHCRVWCGERTFEEARALQQKYDGKAKENVPEATNEDAMLFCSPCSQQEVNE